MRGKHFSIFPGIALAMLLAAGCGQGPGAGEADSSKKGDSNMALTITITSTAFKAGSAIPKKYTGEDVDVSPPLAWSGVPKETKELALICEDPDAPRAEPWVHWVIYNIPPTTTGLPEDVPTSETLADPKDARQGLTDFRKVGYGGPMPPRGHGTHHYHFKLYALDSALNLPPKQTKKQVLDAMKGHILAQGELIGTYERK